MRIRGLWKLPDVRDWLWHKQGLALVSRAILTKSLLQLSADGWGCVPSLLFGLRPICGRSNPSTPLLPGLLYSTVLTIDPCLHWRLLDTMGKSGSGSFGVTSPFSWVLVSTRFCLCPPRVSFSSPVEVL